MGAAGDWQSTTVRGFGGGVNWAENPMALRDDEWADAEGWIARNGYAEVALLHTQLDGTYSSGGHNPVGITQNPFSDVTGYPAIIGFVNDSTGAIKVYRVDPTALVSEITHDGTDTGGGAATPKGAAFAVMGAATMGNFLVLSFGGAPIGGSYSLIRIPSTASTYQTIKPTKQLRGAFLRGFGGHLLLVARADTLQGQRTIYISDANDSAVWDSATSNRADEITLPEASSPLLGLVRIGVNTMGVPTRDSTYIVTPTGADPPFTVQEVNGPGTIERPDATLDTQGGFCGETPYGAAYLGHDDVYLLSSAAGQKGIGRKVIGEIREGTVNASAQGHSPQLVWHPRLGVLLVPVGQQLFAYDPRTDAWSPSIYGGEQPADYFRHAIIQDNSTLTPRHFMLLSQRKIYVESLTNQPVIGGTVQTKDFTSGSPPEQIEVSRIKVDWEPLTDGTTDAIAVDVCARDELGRTASGLGLVGLDGGRLFAVPATDNVGTLTAGKSELSARARGKFMRWQFRQSSGRARIRGFSFLWRRAGDRRTG